MNILVTGGAGYIGSHLVRMLTTLNHTVIVLDTLESGNKKALPSSTTLIEGSVGNRELLASIFTKQPIDAVIHFAGYIQAGESVQNPQKYFDNNLREPTTLLQSMVEHNVKKIIFSSTAAVYGDPQTNSLSETHPKRPTNPYGLSKLFYEETLDYFDRKYGVKFIALRYFNASGAALDGTHGEAHTPESHIIPLAIQAALAPHEFSIFGVDYETKDGTCVRDYIHIEDLATAHVKALEALNSGHESSAFNVGTGNGYSNKEIIQEIEKQTGHTIALIEKPRREGDPHTLVADSTKLQTELGWKPTHSTLDEIIRTALLWHTSHPQGYNQ